MLRITTELTKTERDPISTSGPSIFSMSPNRETAADKSIRFFPLAAAQPLATPSWPEALNARGSRPGCQMAISHNDYSLIALPDFPEIAQAVRHSVPGTRLSIIGGMKQESVTDGEPHAMSLLAERLSDR